MNEIIENNICELSDSYKMGHYKFYLPNTQKIYSYLEARKGAKYPYTVFYGLQYILKKHLVGQVVTLEKIKQAKEIIDQHLGPGTFNEKGWMYILEKHGGKLPVKIRAVDEGSVVPVSNILMSVENTDENCAWLTNYLETVLMQVWYPTTVATKDLYTKNIIKHYYDITESDNTGLPFCLHGFGMRAATSMESSAIADSAHLINFKGTDTVHALNFIKKYYNTKNCHGFSVAATEHSIMTARAEEGEWNVLEHILNVQPNGILSIVIDSYNWSRFIDVCGTKYKDIILNRDGRTVFRPDSGDPVTTTLDILAKLEQYFGLDHTTENGFKVLNNKVRVLWGDGIDTDGIKSILDHMANLKWAAENIVFGMGGHMVQSGLTRDTQRFAFKCSATKYDGEWHDVYKKPIDVSKASKRGLLDIYRDNGEYHTVLQSQCPNACSLLNTVFENGELVREISFEDVIEMIN